MAKLATIVVPAYHRVVIFGGTGVGKTALSKRFVYDEFMEHNYLLYDDYEKKILLDDEEVRFTITPFPKQQNTFARIRDLYFRLGEGFLCIFSITDAASFQATEDFKENLLKVKGDKSIPFLLVGNKCDLEKQRKVTFQEASDRAKGWGVPYVETSAANKEHVDKVFFDLVRKIRARKMEENKRSNGKGTDKSIRKK